MAFISPTDTLRHVCSLPADSIFHEQKNQGEKSRQAPFIPEGISERAGLIITEIKSALSGICLLGIVAKRSWFWLFSKSEERTHPHPCFSCWLFMPCARHAEAKMV